MILETVVGRARWCVWARGCREARRRQAGACNDERQRQAHDQTCQRVRSGERGCCRFSGFTTPAYPLRVLTLTENRIEGIKANIHVEFHKVMSGQLRFLG